MSLDWRIEWRTQTMNKLTIHLTLCCIITGCPINDGPNVFIYPVITCLSLLCNDRALRQYCQITSNKVHTAVVTLGRRNLRHRENLDWNKVQESLRHCDVFRMMKANLFSLAFNRDTCSSQTFQCMIIASLLVLWFFIFFLLQFIGRVLLSLLILHD